MTDNRCADYGRRLLLAGGDLVGVEKEMAEIRTGIQAFAEPPEYFGEELAELTATLAKLKREVIESFDALEKKVRKNKDFA